MLVEFVEFCSSSLFSESRGAQKKGPPDYHPMGL